MADITIKLLEPADSYALLTLAELKAAYAIPPTDITRDAQLQMLIDQYSDVIATMCNRVFAKEKVQETWRGNTTPLDCARIYLTHYPVAEGDVESVAAPDGTLIDPSAYELDNAQGKLLLLGGFAEPVVVTYTGGYDLPEEAPPALKQACQLLVQAGSAMLSYGLMARGNVRSVSHKESRVMYFDPNAAANKASSGKSPLTVAGATVDALLSHYIRFQV